VTDILTRLAAPFPPDRVSWRVGPTTQDKSKGQALAYIDARDVMERLDNVLGADGWQCEYVPMPNGDMLPHRRELREALVWKAWSQRTWKAEKGAYSDAMKRSAVLWGIARYLYDLDCPWVELGRKTLNRTSTSKGDTGKRAPVSPRRHRLRFQSKTPAKFTCAHPAR
jgi:hypothetical protein